MAMFTFLLTLTLSGPVSAQDRIVFEANVFDTGGAEDQMKIMVRSWPIQTRIDQVGHTLQITWPGSAPPEVLPLSEVLVLERARPFESQPDELFAVLNSGRRILLCRGEKTASIVKLAAAMVGKELVSLPMGEGHATRPPTSPQDPILLLAAGANTISTTPVNTDSFLTEGPRVAGDRDGASIGKGGTGGIEKQTVDQVVKKHMPLFRQCYEQALTQSPTLEGKITIGFVIVGSGAVGAATIQSNSMNDPAIGSCVRQRMMSIQFPAPKGNTTAQISYPFVFSSH
jgi:hypothetical protein